MICNAICKTFIAARPGLASLLLLAAATVSAAEPVPDYSATVLQQKPLLYLSFDHPAADVPVAQGQISDLEVSKIGKAGTKPGPRPYEYPLFSSGNQAIGFAGGDQRLIVRSASNGLQLGQGDAFTIEAWVKPDSRLKTSFPYIVGKGRTHNSGFNPNNQNYSLRLVGGQGTAPLSFFFVDAEILNGGSTETNGHRWTSQAGVPLDGNWHHVALVYEFGKPESIKGYIDGKPTAGKWDLAGATTKPPITDADEVWIGSSMKGQNSFQGELDELAIFNKILPEADLKARFRHNRVDYVQQLVEQTKSPAQHVQVDVHEAISSSRDWNFRPTAAELAYQTDAFALTRLPRKYNPRGIIIDRPAPLLVHLHSEITLPAGTHEFVVRSLNAARLYVDGKLRGANPFMNLHSSAHGTMHHLVPPQPGELSIPAAHQELRIPFTVTTSGPHRISLLTIAGHKSLPATVGELTVAIGPVGGTKHLLGPDLKWAFTDEAWLDRQEQEEQRLVNWNREQRLAASASEIDYWQKRHARARKWVESQPAVEVPHVDSQLLHPIDQFIAAGLKRQSGLEPTPVIDDWTFLRRATLDLTGTNPTPEQIEAFFADPSEQRREYAIQRLLDHPHWADHWVPYWQDVLAENPGLTKPMLNNSGPFRYYLHEAFAENRPFDRIVTELLLMEGSRSHGGTAGFAIASNNDVPMAAKAHILGTAFLGVEMKCARCHDAPYHESLQRDLFEVAALLNGKSVAVPKTSSVPGTPEQLANMAVQVTLMPGEEVAPNWPFADLISAEQDEVNRFVRDSKNQRELLATLVTHHQNTRFAQVIVNRVWQRLLGRGIVDLVEDWETGTTSHPELLEWLAQEFVRDGYDLKKLSSLIMTSQVYQREALSGKHEAQTWFAGPTRRRLTAEQLVDTLYQAVGKPLPAEQLTYNSDGRQGDSTFLDFGVPKKAWELVAISNERERPSMNLPKAQSLADLMATFGWRSERQDPVTIRENTATALQPLALANGTALNRAVDISDHSQILELCLTATSPEDFVRQLFLRILSRPPADEERAMFVALVEPGFADRKTEYQTPPPRKVFRSPLTWTAHFDPDASEEGLQQQIKAEQGDLPTQLLQPEWRQRAEDAAWVLFNNPEFVFVP